MNLKDLDRKTERLLFHLWLLTGHFNALLQSCSDEECDLSVQELKAVEYLGRIGPSKMKDLADHLKLAVSSTTTLVDNLEVKGDVQRERSLEDRRVIILRLTEEGHRCYQMTLTAYTEFCKKVLMDLDVEDQDALLRILGKIRSLYG